MWKSKWNWGRLWNGAIEESGNFPNGIAGGVSNGNTGGGRCRRIEDGKEILRCIPKEVFCGGLRERNIFWEILDCVSDACFVGCGNKAIDAAIMFHGRSDVPGVGATWCPGCSIVRFLMD